MNTLVINLKGDCAFPHASLRNFAEVWKVRGRLYRTWMLSVMFRPILNWYLLKECWKVSKANSIQIIVNDWELT